MSSETIVQVEKIEILEHKHLPHEILRDFLEEGRKFISAVKLCVKSCHPERKVYGTTFEARKVYHEKIVVTYLNGPYLFSETWRKESTPHSIEWRIQETHCISAF